MYFAMVSSSLIVAPFVASASGADGVEGRAIGATDRSASAGRRSVQQR